MPREPRNIGASVRARLHCDGLASTAAAIERESAAWGGRCESAQAGRIRNGSSIMSNDHEYFMGLALDESEKARMSVRKELWWYRS